MFSSNDAIDTLKKNDILESEEYYLRMTESIELSDEISIQLLWTDTS